MAEWTAIGHPDGRITLGRSKASIIEYLQRQGGEIALTITHDPPESNKKRKWFEGGLVRLICYYQEGFDHNNPEHRRRVREWLKVEFNADLVTVAGKVQRVARSTKGRMVFDPYVERVENWFIENYSPPIEAMDPKKWKHWHETIFPSGGPDNYIDYLIEIGILKPQTV
ncbi:protein of unknown function [Bradyrhizobium sp. ORS 285]|uniref:hypothetical protein n=1 Tax=Bradyrhizobium sp. ORS 285 TaxID=115808 RepID=UPI00024095B2|nr:hypothetical protein [Bradyrhizobium sp. ORS 285]CCD89878.1 hypothetical protein BRAO285_850084 [Bradyrhizobium sp. ORS 285]SMX61497.1 protein of unknown function [Bradyrhizobium sp. ORS 285]